VARSKKASEQSPTDGTRKANHRGAMIAVLAAFGVLIGISALKTDQDRTETNAERAELVVQIHNREDHLAGLRATSSSLENDVTRLQGSVEAQITRITTVNGQVGDLGLVAGMFAAQGQGIVVTVDDAPAAQRGSGGVILDSDLQALVNALWVSGAEAISIDGHRLTSVTSIRFAGQAITVDYRSLTPPYVISAIGNTDTLPARLLETAGGQTWLGLKTNFGIRFDTETKDNITVPADPHEHLLYARAVTR
jgi:uncharacterized protein YlxW (UPF0749 family)